MLRKSRSQCSSSSGTCSASAAPLLTTLTPQNSQEEWLSSGSMSIEEEDDRPTVTFTSTQPSTLNDDNDGEEDDQWESILQLESTTSTVALELPPTYCLQHRLLYWTLVSFPTLLRDLVRLTIFVVFLAPAFARFVLYYITCDRVVVKYGDSVRHSMDIYGSKVDDDGNGANLCDSNDLNYSNSNNMNHTSTQQQQPQQAKKPVLIFFTGGAWVIGYKMWGAFLAKVFAAMGVLVVVPDYRNYPVCTVPNMVQDTEDAIQWVIHNIQEYHGDSTRILVAGQSAGGHLVATVLLKKALAMLHRGDSSISDCTPSTSSFKPTYLAGFCCISAPSDVQAMSTNFQKHGLDQSFVQSLFGVKANSNVSMDDYDPQRLVEQLQRELQYYGCGNQDDLIPMDQDMPTTTTSSSSSSYQHHNTNNTTQNNTSTRQPSISIHELLPPMSIFHGTADQTVPYEVSERFASSLQECGVQAEYVQYQGWSHTDPILEAIMMADHRFHADMYQRLYQWTIVGNDESVNSSGGSREYTTATTTTTDNSNPTLPQQQHPLLARSTLDDSIPECKPLCYTPLVKAARFVNPF